mmetsp:Transcript_25854/g.77630  ORF Transcript_25854/g.77630 Transcript_25854/m.77630 type:complete len:320 (-) Transcript_25854:66-1025(-)
MLRCALTTAPQALRGARTAAQHVKTRLVAAPARPHARELATYATYANRAVAAPYALLACIPLTSSALAAYHLARGDADQARGCSFFAVTGFLSLPFSVPMFLTAPYTLLCDPFHRRWPDWVQRNWGKATTALFFDTKVRGLEKLEGVGPAVFVSNHASWLDIYALFWVDPLALRIVAKKEIMRIPLCGWVMHIIGHIPYDRQQKGAGVLKACGELLEHGVSVFFFPEGTRGRGALLPFKPGAFVLAARRDVPVVPISIVNTGYLMPPGNEFWEGGKLRTGRDVLVIVHDPIYPDRGAPDVVKDLETRARRAIEAGLPPP